MSIERCWVRLTVGRRSFQKIIDIHTIPKFIISRTKKNEGEKLPSFQTVF